jgi:GntR family transcriptional regulator
LDLNRYRLQIDRSTPMPLYYQLRQIIKADIDSNALRPGDMIEPEVELCAALSISRPTVRQALNSLVADGYLLRTKGKGTFVARQKLEANFIQKLESFQFEMQSQGIVSTIKVLRLEIVSEAANINEKLGLGISEKLICLQRLCLANGKPILYLESYLPANRFASLIEEDMASTPLYPVLHTKYNVNVVHVHKQIEAVNATSAESELLDMGKNKAVCLVRHIAYDEQGLPVEYCIAKYRGDQNKFTLDMYREVAK